MAIYKLKKDGVILNDLTHIPNNLDNRHWQEFEAWKGEGNTPEPADPEPKPEAPEPTVSDVIEAIDAKDKGNSAKWDALKR